MNTLLLVATLLTGTKCAAFINTDNVEYVNLQYSEITDINVYDANIGLDDSFKYVGNIELKVNEFQSQQVGLLCQ